MKTTQYQTKSIKAWLAEDRPRERLQELGPANLSNSELIALILGTGSSKTNAIDLARAILTENAGQLARISRLDVEDLCAYHGMGPAKAVKLVATMELAKRLRAEDFTSTQLKTARDVFKLMSPLIGGLKTEQFWIIFLNNANKMIKRIKIGEGGISGVYVDQRLVFKYAIGMLATGVILCHNHPSGSVRASEADKNLTKRFLKAGAILDIQITDHVIVSEKDYFSFSDAGLL